MSQLTQPQIEAAQEFYAANSTRRSSKGCVRRRAFMP